MFHYVDFDIESKGMMSYQSNEPNGQKKGKNGSI